MLTKLQHEPYRRAETELQEGHFEKYLTIEGLPPGFSSFDVGRLLHQIDNKLEALTLADNITTRDRLRNSASGDLSSSLTAVVHDIIMSGPLLDFIERRTQGPPAAQNIFFRRGSQDIPVWSSLSVA